MSRAPEVKGLSLIEEDLLGVERAAAQHARNARGMTRVASVVGGYGLFCAMLAVTTEHEGAAIGAGGMAILTGAVAIRASISAIKSHTQVAALEGAVVAHSLMQAQRETDALNAGGLQ